MEKRKVVVVVDLRSDLKAIRGGINVLRIAKKQDLIDWEVLDVCSAHRNGGTLRKNLKEYTEQGVDAIIAVAGKLAALFGDVDAYLRNELGNSKTRVIAVPLKGKTEQASLAALYSVLEVPNHRLVFQEEFYHDPTAAFEYAVSGELAEIQLEEQKQPERLTSEDAYEASRIKYPEAASYDWLIKKLEDAGLHHLYTGKTRESFINYDFPDLLYIVATDRISIFDIVLNAKIKLKGAVLTGMTVHWLRKVFSDVPNHLVACGDEIREYLPKEIWEDESLRDYLFQNMLVVKKTKVLKVEAIVRGFLTGSGWKDYQKTGMVCGIILPEGLQDGSELPEPIFTPSTKADHGLHDENISFEEAAKIIGEENAKFIRDKSLELYTKAREIARKAGIIIADTKFEFGIDKDGNILLIDEVLTPDSSRFWPENLRQAAMLEGKTPPSLDKQPVRDAGAAGGVKNDPTWVPSGELLDETSASYQRIFRLLEGRPLEMFWWDQRKMEP